MPTVKELRETRAPIRTELTAIGKRIADESRGLNAEEKAKVAELEGRFTSLTQAIDDQVKLNTLTADDGDSDGKAGRNDTRPASPRTKRERLRADRAAATDEHRATALQAWVRRANQLPLKSRHVKACRAANLDPSSRRLEIRLASRPPRFRRDGTPVESRDLATTASGTGGVTVPKEFSNTLEFALKANSGPRQVADVFRTSTGAELQTPGVDDTANEGELVAENAEVSYLDPTFTARSMYAFKYGSKMIKISFELLNDSAFNLAQVLGQLCGERIGRIQTRHLTTGTGVGQPQGIVTGSTLGRTAASATAISVVDLVQLVYSVDPAYRNAPGAGFMFNDKVLLALMLLTDTTGKPIFMEGYRDDEPDRILKKPFTINTAMTDTIAAGQKSAIFGDLTKYKVRDAGPLRLRRLDERYAEKDQTGFVAFLRTDGRLAVPAAVKHLLH